VRRSLPFILLLCLLAAVPATAGAATRHVVKGAGFGHGIGMSQYGAYGHALAGVGYRRILAHYYDGTRISSAPSRPVRVLLQPVDPYIRVAGATRAGSKRLDAGKTYVVKRSGSGVVVRTSGGKLVGRFAGSVQLSRGGGAPVRLLGPALNGVSSGRYRGAIEVIPDDSGVTAINVLDIDRYVKGVVPGEMPASWPLEALKAQAVTARTYALATRKSGVFDQYPDTRSQVYRGVTAESVTSNAAVDRTAGEVLTYGGEPAVTYYHSTSGGHTENVEKSFLGSLSKPWLVGVSDPYDAKSPYHRWRVTLSTSRITSLLSGYVKGRFKRLKVLTRGASPRVVRARIYGTGGTSGISGPTLRSELGLRDSWLTIYSVSSSARSSRSARPASWGGRPTPGILACSFQPLPRGRRLVVERRTGDGWRLVKRIRAAKTGGYRVALDRGDIYRVRAGDVAGPAVRVR
jgi:stage II sporulation protein D